MKLVLFTVIDNLLTRNHSVISFNSLFIRVITVLKLRSAKKMFVSFANKTSWTNIEALQISLIKITKLLTVICLSIIHTMQQNYSDILFLSACFVLCVMHLCVISDRLI